MNNFFILIFSVCSYLIGSINWSVIISKKLNKDIRELGSGNPGTLNMSRNFGLKFGLLTFFLDVLKGAVPTLIAFFFFRNLGCFDNSDFLIFDFALYLVGLCAVLGHIFPLYMHFKGGKGIASTIGVLTVCESVHGLGWAAIVIMAIVGAVAFIYFTEFGAMGSFIAITPPAISGCIRLFITYWKSEYKITTILNLITSLLIFFICFFTWFAHRKNIERMLSGDEHPTSIKSMVVKNKIKKEQNKKNNQ